MAYSVVALLLVVAVTASNALSIVPFPKSGSCPRFYSLRPCLEGQVEPNACAFDHQCPGTLKCCQSTCGKTCTKPVRVCPVVNELVCGGLDCSSRGGFATDRNGCEVCLCARCPKGGPVVNCFADPCQVTKCELFPTATCVSSYCGTCQANFFVNGKPVKCIAEDTCHLPKVPGPCRGSLPRWHHNPITHQCELFTYGGCQGNANNFPSQDACNKKCDVCHLPKEPGTCKGYFPRWHHNPTTHQCERFIYGGCHGNANNFATLNECNKKCIHPVVDKCHLPKVPGPCRGSFLRWHHSPTTHQCEKFTYGGCGGNGNNFATLSECNKKCIHPVVDKCHLPKVPGPCLGSFLRWHHSPTTHQCEKFIYGGCQGNANNFLSVDTCNEKCGHPVISPCDRVLCVPPTCPQPIFTPGQCCGRCNQNCALVRCLLSKCVQGTAVIPPGECCAQCPLVIG